MNNVFGIPQKIEQVYENAIQCI